MIQALENQRPLKLKTVQEGDTKQVQGGSSGDRVLEVAPLQKVPVIPTKTKLQFHFLSF